ncbi:MAG: C-GCAxxG-C-C family protein [Intestinibacillus sp.]
MESRVQQTIDRHKKGYNCAQAVACTYCDLFGVDEQTAYKMAEGFGLGMGQQNVCGALTGALMLAGLENSGGIEVPGTTKGATYKKARDLAAQFEDTAGALLCKDIKAEPIKCSCEGCIRHAAHLVEENLLTRNQ